MNPTIKPLTERQAWNALAAPTLNHDSSTNNLIRRYRKLEEAL
jgi:hypothetical protein